MSLLSPRKDPTLPQQDKGHALRARERQLEDARETWTWTTTVSTLPGVPLAAKVPREDEPSLPWLLAVAKVGLRILENALAVRRASRGDLESTREDPESKELAELRDAITEIEEAHTADGLLEAATGALLYERRRGQMNDLLERLNASVQRSGLRLDETLSGYEALFQTIPLPDIANTFMEDSTFARLRVAGENPMSIRGISTLPASFPLSAQTYAEVTGGDDLQAALSESRIFLLDYAELLSIVPGVSGTSQKYTWSPIALFYRPKDGSSLVPVAIQCGQDPAKHPIFTPSKTKSWGWEMAKTIVAVADTNYHELFAHLARTHLLVEAFCVATHRQLADVHPLSILLLPHFEGTLFINNSAATGLIAAGGPIDTIFGGTIQSIQQAAATDRLAIDFTASMLENDLIARGVASADVLPDYPYRDDARLVWGAIESWVRSYLGLYYTSPELLTGDTELAAWLSEVRGSGRVTGVPEVKNLDDLTQIVTMVIFTASAQHAAVNFPQSSLMSFAPAATGGGWAPGPDVVQPSEPAWAALLPPISVAQQQMQLLELLGGVYYAILGQYRTNNVLDRPWFEDPKVTADGGPLAAFNAALRRVEDQISVRNQSRKVAYTFLLPSLIPQSINI